MQTAANRRADFLHARTNRIANAKADRERSAVRFRIANVRGVDLKIKPVDTSFSVARRLDVGAAAGIDASDAAPLAAPPAHAGIASSRDFIKQGFIKQGFIKRGFIKRVPAMSGCRSGRPNPALPGHRKNSMLCPKTAGAHRRCARGKRS